MVTHLSDGFVPFTKGADTMKKSLQLLSEAGESLDYLRDEVRYLGLYVTELETLVEAYRSFVVNTTLLSIPELARRTNLLRDTEKILGLTGSADLADSETTEMVEVCCRAAHLGSAGPP
jgi:hypothetical protein